ncbi:DUF4209 domain-containing protein [Lutibacter sp. B2]|nr:DUF4209 domain-containing protein [Lutibacter sp. B2]
MKERLKKLSQLLDEIRYNELEEENYLECGFSEDETKTFMEIYYTVSEVWNTRKGEYVHFVNEVLEHCSDIRITFYMMCYLSYFISGKKRYRLAKDLIGIVITEHTVLFDFNDDKLVERTCLNNVVKLSSQMKINMVEIAEVLFKYIDATNNIHSFTGTIEHLLHKISDADLNKHYTDLYEKIVASLLSKEATSSLKYLLGDLEREKNKFFSQRTILEPLAYLMFDLGQAGNGMREIMFLNDSREAFIELDNKEMETKALAALENAVSNNTIDWHVSEVSHGEDELKELQRIVDLQRKYLEESKLEEIIGAMDKIVSYKDTDFLGNRKRRVVYRACPNYKMILDSAKYSITEQIFTSISLGENRVVSNRDYKARNKGIYYENSFRFNVLPVLSFLEEYNVLFLSEVRKLINESDWISDGTRRYYFRIEKYYSKDNSFEFMHFCVILIEKLLRDLHKKILGTQITSMRSDKEAQLNTNLQEIMRKPEIQEFFRENVYRYLEYALIDDTGLNLRNNALHGLLDLEVFHHNYSRILMHIILVIITHSNTKFMEREKQGR